MTSAHFIGSGKTFVDVRDRALHHCLLNSRTSDGSMMKEELGEAGNLEEADENFFKSVQSPNKSHDLVDI